MNEGQPQNSQDDSVDMSYVEMVEGEVASADQVTEIPAELSDSLMRLYSDMGDSGQIKQLGGEARSIIESIGAVDPATQVALAEKFHQETIVANFSSDTMAKFLGVYNSLPPGPFRDKLQQVESTRLGAAGYSGLQ